MSRFGPRSKLLGLALIAGSFSGSLAQQTLDQAHLTEPLIEEAHRAMYGIGRPRDFIAATKLLDQAVTQGSHEAEAILGSFFLFGYGMPRDPARALAIESPLADKKEPAAQYFLGLMYEFGHGVATDKARAGQLLTASADGGYLPAKTALGTHLVRMGTLDNIRGGTRLWLQAAEAGDRDAETNLGSALLYARGTPRDIPQARVFLERAAQQNMSEAEYLLGMIYLGGWDVTVDKQTGFLYILKAAGHHNPKAEKNWPSFTCRAKELQ